MTLDEFIEVYGYTKNISNNEWVKIRPEIIELLHKFDDNRFNLVNKGRQVGLTTAMRLYSFYLAIKDDQPKHIIYYTNSGDSLRKFIGDIFLLMEVVGHKALANCDFELNTRSTSKLRFSDGSTISGVCGLDSFRGRNFQPDLVLIDEYARLRDIDEILPIIVPMLHEQSKMVIGSTPNGENMFYTLWVGNMVPFEKTVLKNNEFNLTWEEDQRRHLNQESFDVEINARFIDREGIYLPETFTKGLIKYNIIKHKLTNGNR